MASLGNLYFNIKFNSDPKELEEFKKRVLAQLAEVEVSIGIVPSKDELTKTINQVLNEKYKLNLTVDKEEVGAAINNAVKQNNTSISTQEAQAVSNQAEAYRELESAINSIIGTRGQNIKRLTEEKTALASVQSQLKIYEKQQQSGVILNKDQLKNKASLINKEYEHKQAISELNQLIKSDVKLSQSASTSMDEMSIKLARMKVAYKSLSDEMKQSPFGQQLQNQITVTDQALKKADASIGNHQRNVGNYKAQWDGLQWQVTQLAREMPSMAYGMNVFFAAISNNWPMLADEIKKANIEYKALKASQAQGMNLDKQAVPVWKQLIKGVVSWQTALLILTTVLITQWGAIKNWVSGLFSAQNAIKLTREEVKKLNEEFASLASSEIAKLNTLFDRLNKAKEGTAEWNKARADIINQHGDTLNAMNTEIAALNDKAGAYRALRDEIYATAKAEAVEKATQDARDKATETAIKGYDKIYKEAVAKQGEEYADSLIERVRNDIESAGKLSEELTKEITDVFTETYTKRSGGISYVHDEETAYNNVEKAINGIIDAQDELASKKEQAEGVFSWLKIPEEAVKENKAYWESQRNEQQKLLDGLTEEEAKAERGLAIKKEIAKINEVLSAYDTKENKESAEKENKELRDRLTLLKNANDLYKEWLSLGVGRSEATSRVNDMLGIDFKPDDYRKNIESIRKQASGKKNQSIRVEASQILTGLDKDTVGSALSDLEKYISDTVSKWNLFDKLFEKTGDYDFSMKGAFGDNVQFKSAIEQLKSDIESALSATGISFDEIIQMSPENIKSEHGATLSSLVKAYQDQNKKIKEDTITTLADLLAETKSYEQKRADITNKWSKIIDDPSLGDKERGAAESKRDEEYASLDFEQLKNTELWIKVFDDLDRVSGETLDQMILQLEEFSETASKLPINQFKEYMNTLKKIRKESESRNPLKSLIEGFKELGEAVKGKNAGGIQAAQDKIKDAAKEIVPYADQIGGALGSLSEMFDSLGSEGMSSALDNAQEVFSSISNIGQGFAKGGLIGGIGAAVGEAAKWATKAFEAAARHKEALSEIMKEATSQQRAYNLLLKQQNLEYEKASTIFGADDYSKATNAIKVLKEAVADLNAELAGTEDQKNNLYSGFFGRFKELTDINAGLKKTYAGLASIQIKTGHQKTGLFGWGKGKDIYSSVLDVYPELIDANGNFNSSLAETILQTRTMSDENKAALQAMIDYSKVAEDALDAAKDYLTGIFGELGSSISDALVDAFRNGTDAAKAFTDSVTGMLEKMIESMIYAVTLAPIFEKANDDMMKIMKDPNMTDDQKMKAYVGIMDGIIDSSIAVQDGYNGMLESIKEYAKGKGLNLWAPDDTGRGGLASGIKGVTEDTASLLASYLNATRADVNQQLVLIRRLIDNDMPKMSVMAQAQLNELRTIANNTGRNADAADEILSYISNAFDPGTRGFRMG